MGIDISGKLFVGAHYSEFDGDVKEAISEEFDCIIEWAEEHNMDYSCPRFDCCETENYYGYSLEQVDPTGSDYANWCANVKTLADEFERLTGATAKIIGMQHVY